MYKILKHRWDDKDKIFWVSDTHAYHDPIHWEVPLWKSRGYNSAEEAAEDKIEKINAKVGKDDILYHLGDGFLNATDDQVKSWLGRINCQNIRWLWGNHESNLYRLYKQEIKSQYGLEGVEIYPLRMGNVEFLGNHLEIEVGKQKIIMNHFPLRIWHKNGKGSWMLSGHSHLTDKGRHPNNQYARAMDCGWDWNKDVWSFAEIRDIMSTKEVEILDHHNQYTT